MNPSRNASRWHFRATVILTSILLAACGGGSEVLGPGSGGTGTSVTTTAVGPISGFGSVIVNGIRYDDSAAQVSDDRGSSLSRSQLRLGMMVQIRGSANATTGVGTASSVIAFSELKGQVDSVSAGNLLVNGVIVRVVATTILDGAAVLNAGDFVEVYGLYDPTTNELIATRVEKRSADDYKLRGTVSAWDTANSQFMLGTTLVSYAGTTLPAGFDNGQAVRAYATGAPNAGVWPVADIRRVDDYSLSDDSRAEIEGVVSAFVSLAEFELNGVRIDGSGAQFEDGSAADVRVGARLEVKGTFANGILMASRIEIEDGSSSSGSGSGSSSGEIELHGLVSDFVSLANFTVRNSRVDASASPTFERGTAANLVNGACVEIKGNAVSDASGSVVRATEVKFDNDC